MILGVFHFHNPGADAAQFKGIDVLAPDRQREIAAIVDGVVAFRPTKVAVEKTPERVDSINAEYRRYREGTFELGASETYQLGFRLADRMELDRLYGVDFKLGLRFDSIMAYAGQHDPDYIARFQEAIRGIEALFDSLQQNETIAVNLRWMNTPERMDWGHEPYTTMATVGAGDGYIGARVVADWYNRNLHMFANVSRVAAPGDRIILIVGSGHAPILRDLVRTHPAMELVEPLDFLP